MKRLACAFLVVGLASCRTAHEDASPQETGPTGPRSLVLITIDTLRADYVGYTGAGKVRTPHLDRLAGEGVVFLQARSPVPLTLPSHASILTGAYPPAHGVRVNGLHRLSDDQTTLAEVLKAKGYRTGAFIGSFVLDRRYGLAQGFDDYNDELGAGPAVLENLEAERNADAVLGAFRDWLGAHSADGLFFAWVHFYDPHAPYDPPEPFRKEYPHDPYASEVAYTDAVVGKLAGELETRGLLSRVLVAVVGDHGEGLSDHGEQTHSLLIYNATLHVPLLLYAPGLLPQGRRIEALVRTIDLAPTLLDYLGEHTTLGQGKSLRRLIERGKEDSERTAYSESLYAQTHLGWAELRGLESGGFHYISAPGPELYNLDSDPGERRNVLASQEARSREMEAELRRMREEPKGAGESMTIDAEAEARLRALGYVSSTVSRSHKRALDSPEPRRRGGGAPRHKPIDPKDKIPLWNALQQGVYELGRGRPEPARAIFESVLETERDIPLVYQNLGRIYLQLGRPAEAEGVYKEALARGLEDADFHLNLGIMGYQRRRWDEARKELQTAVTLDPRNVAALYYLGNVLRASGQLEEAIGQYRKALDVNPRYLHAYDGMGIAYAKLNQGEEALRSFREVVRLDPEGSQGYFNLAVQLERMGKKREALATYRDFLGRKSGAPDELTERAKRAVARLKSTGRN